MSNISKIKSQLDFCFVLVAVTNYIFISPVTVINIEGTMKKKKKIHSAHKYNLQFQFYEF